ncbi:nuclear transport factor 2 family protein [Aquimarina sp. D1M17]|uniref:nuclear transport factor 2 family protein n=1 Tax=Aquimarina acroporae TaxID=2937283 RepID=UPI0020BEB957|nr:nuclear transport factor 2 family protein [Aquimarina acroporae]MCK8520506.1 nuclear transport factor 2 family protein [Aquimarina acroporae]
MYTQKITEIETVIANYFEGIFYGDISKLSSCFHKDTILYGDIEGANYVKNLDEYLDGVKNRKSPSELGEALQMKVIGIDVMGKIAMVKLHVPMLGYNYYDYLSIVKVNQQWKIVNKLFTHVA